MADWIREVVAGVVGESSSYAQCLRRMKLPLHAGNYRTLKRKIRVFGLNIDHFDHEPPDYLKGKGPNIYELKDVLVKNSPYAAGSYALKNKLFKHGQLKNECYECGILSGGGNLFPCI
jgi:hypothetical protein